MSLEFVREMIKVSQVIGEDSSQTVVENDIIVPDVKPDIAQILLLDGDVYANRTEAMHDKIMVTGTILFKILYIPDDSNDNIKSINTSVPFSYGMDMTGSRQGMNCKVNCDIEHIDYEILNGRKINIKTILRIGARAYQTAEQEIIEGLRGIDDIQVLKENVRVNSFIGSNKSQYTVREALEIPSGKPSIREILRNDVKITGKDFRVTDNKVVAKGDINVSTLYIGDDDDSSLQIVENEIPFTHFIDLEGVDEESSCEVDFDVVNAQFEAVENNDGEIRAIECDVVLNIDTEGYAKKNIEKISDAYCSRSSISFDREDFTTEEVVVQTRSQVILKDTLTIKEDSPEIGEVFNVLSKPVLSECSITEDKITIEGLTNNNVLYLSNDSEKPICCHNEEVPFRHTIDVKGANSEMPCEISMEVEHCNYSMVSSTEVEVRVVINLNIKVINQVTLPLIVKVNESPIEDRKLINQPSITIYFAKPGDTLWEVAKRYLTSVSDIQSINGLSEDDVLTAGQQIIIPKKVF